MTALRSSGGVCAPVSDGYIRVPPWPGPAAWPQVAVFPWSLDARPVRLLDVVAERDRLQLLDVAVAAARAGSTPATIQVPVRIRAQRGGIRFIAPPVLS